MSSHVQLKARLDSYRLAQQALSDLKSAIISVLASSDGPVSNAAIGRSLGIYRGHAGHEGHIPRTLLELMKEEGVAEQDPETKLWRLRVHSCGDTHE